MTRDELDNFKKACRDAIATMEHNKEKTDYYDHYDISTGTWYHLTDELNCKREEASCIDMIDSIICYHCYGMSAEKVLDYERHSYKNYLEEHIELLGEQRVLELIQGQIDSIDGIEYSTFVDNEGLVYNSIMWKPVGKTA